MIASMFNNYSKEIVTLQQREVINEARISALQQEIETLKTNMQSLRGLVNRRLYVANVETEQTDHTEPGLLQTNSKRLNTSFNPFK